MADSTSISMHSSIHGAMPMMSKRTAAVLEMGNNTPAHGITMPKKAEGMKFTMPEDHRKAMSAEDKAKEEAYQRKLNAAAEDFEAVFLSQMLQHMFDGIEPDETFGGGHAEEVYQSFMVEEYGKIIARSGGIGMKDHVLRQMEQVSPYRAQGK
jgi:peptidoglycan hydrolase FlgJ